MALANCGRIYWPPLTTDNGANDNSLFFATHTYDSASDRLAWVGNSTVTDTLSTVYFRTGTVTTGCTVDVRIETVTNGRPTGTLFGTNTNVTVVIADTDDNVWKTATLTAGASLTKGDQFAIVMVVSSGTPNLQIGGVPGAFSQSSDGLYPITLQDTGAGTWAGITGLLWIAEFTTAGPTYLPRLYANNGAGTITSFNSGTSPNERALRFQVPFTCRVAGLRIWMFNVAAGADSTASIWNTTGTTDAAALAQKSLDGDFPTSTTIDGCVDFIFPTPVTLSVNTTYYAGLRADTANNIGLGSYANASVTNAVRAMAGVNAQTYLSTRVWSAGTAGAWTDTTTTVPFIYLLIDQLDDGASAGGTTIAGTPMRRGMV